MSTQSLETSRGESRYRASESGRARVLVERPDIPDALSAIAEMIDLSQGGIRLALDEPLKFSENVLLRLEHDPLAINLSLSATVRWIRAAPDGRWMAGCSFSPALPPDGMQELFEKGLLERRRSRRQVVRGRLEARWELNSQPVPAELVDLSTGGFAIRGPRPVGLGTWMQVSFARPDGTQASCEAKAQWCLETGGAFVVGCEFVASSGYALLQEIAERAPLAVPQAAGAGRRSGLAVEAGLLLAIAAAAGVTWWLSR